MSSFVMFSLMRQLPPFHPHFTHSTIHFAGRLICFSSKSFVCCCFIERDSPEVRDLLLTGEPLSQKVCVCDSTSHSLLSTVKLLGCVFGVRMQSHASSTFIQEVRGISSLSGSRLGIRKGKTNGEERGVKAVPKRGQETLCERNRVRV